jgi:hypothetical protein
MAAGVAVVLAHRCLAAPKILIDLAPSRSGVDERVELQMCAAVLADDARSWTRGTRTTVG